jgi:hypothetical protein
MKLTFSERMGYKKPREVIQFESMDNELRIALWNTIYVSLFNYPLSITQYIREMFPKYKDLFKLIWTDYFHRNIDEIPANAYRFVEQIKKRFFEFDWFEVYDFCEFLTNNFDERFIDDAFNKVLEEYLSGYRMVSKIIVPITSKDEVETIETAIEFHTTISHHLNVALKLLSDKSKPDFRNSIKESISAVEALARMITGNQKATLGSALNEIEESGNIAIHKALKDSFSKMYGWTSDDEGIRHSLVDKSTLSQEDAIFMLVTCSAFINYLVVKTQKAGINLSDV